MKPERKNQSDYTFFKEYSTRWRDNDVYLHMNNSVFYEYIDSIVNYWLIESGALVVPNGGIIGLVVKTKCNYFASLGYPEPVVCGLGLKKKGRSSVSYEVGLFPKYETFVAAQATLTHVYVDSITRKPVGLPTSLISALQTLQKIS